MPEPTVKIRDCVARPNIDNKTLAEYSGQVVAMCNTTGEVVLDAESIDQLTAKMEAEKPEVKYRVFCCR